MRNLITIADLKQEISDRMAGELTHRSPEPRPFWAKPVPCERIGDEPNWRLAFDPGKVPDGYVETWERIRPEFEDRYDLVDKD